MLQCNVHCARCSGKCSCTLCWHCLSVCCVCLFVCCVSYVRCMSCPKLHWSCCDPVAWAEWKYHKVVGLPCTPPVGADRLSEVGKICIEIVCDACVQTSRNCVLTDSLLRGEIDWARLPCTCRLTYHAPSGLPLARQAGSGLARQAANKEEASQSSWASRKKLGWHRNHPAPHQGSTSHNSWLHFEQVPSLESWANIYEYVFDENIIWFIWHHWTFLGLMI